MTTHLTFFQNHVPLTLNINWRDASGNLITDRDTTYMVIVRKPASYRSPTIAGDDAISAAFRQSIKAPLLSVVSEDSKISLPPEKLNELSPGIYPLLILVCYPANEIVIAEQGTLEIIDPTWESYDPGPY